MQAWAKNKDKNGLEIKTKKRILGPILRSTQ